jgi:hypothetical protein
MKISILIYFVLIDLSRDWGVRIKSKLVCLNAGILNTIEHNGGLGLSFNIKRLFHACKRFKVFLLPFEWRKIGCILIFVYYI